MALYLTEAEVQSLVTMEDAIAALADGFGQWGKGGTATLPRGRLPLPGGKRLNLMASAIPGSDVFGIRAYYSLASGGNNLVLLFSITDTRLLAIIESRWASATRTGAATGLATRLMARKDAGSVAIIGTAHQAAPQLHAVSAVRPITRVAAYSRDQGRRETFAARMTDELGIPVTAAPTAEACIDGADIVITMTNSTTPVLQGSWLVPGQHINAAGANSANRRELDDDAVLKADIKAVDDKAQARIEAGAFIELVEEGRLEWADIKELGTLVQGEVPGRTGDDQITLYKSLGIPLEDVAFAKMIYSRAKEQGVGSEFAG